MSTTVTSSIITFMDTSDNRKLDVYITSNLPNTQIKNINTNTYTPNWASTPLVLEADAYLDSQDVNNKTTFSWYKKNALGVETLINANAKTITINSNALDDGQLVVYVCRALYKASDADNGIEDIEQITFSQVTTGLNGTNGNSAPAVQAQYSVDGTANWTATLNAATHKYIRYSYDGGATWTTAIKMVGDDGTSVKIKGTATSKTAVSGTSYYTLVYNSATITGAAIGDAYLLDGNMYVCVDSRDGNDYFMDVGHIQGPQGNDGQSSYVFIRYATDANGANMAVNPTSTTTHIGICTVNTNVAPTTANSYTWSKFVGDNAKSIVLTGSAQVFKVSKANAYTPSTISVTATQVNTTITEWTYSINGGQTFLSTVPTGVVRNGNIVTVTGSTLASNSLVIKASDGQYSDVFTVYKAFDGTDGTPGNPGAPASMAFLTNENISFSANSNGQVALTTFTTNVVAYNGTNKVTPTIGTIGGLPSGMTVSDPITSANEQILTFTIAKDSNLGSASSNNGTITIPVTAPVSTNLILSWSKINTGATGVGISSTTVTYGVSDSSSTQPTEWQSSLPTVEDGKYLWTRTVIDYTDSAKADTVTYTYAKQGTIGEKGNPGSSVAVSSIQYQEGASATTAPTGTWQSAVVAIADGKYLWTKTTFSDGKVAYGVAKQGSAGTPASLVNITPSALYFKSTTGANGTFTPQYIYLYPRFQSATYSNWQYSRDGGATWTSASGANGLAIGTYNSVANSLRIDRVSTLYTNDITSISFKCNSTNASVYDTVSIAKLYDVVDLQIGGRNLLYQNNLRGHGCVFENLVDTYNGIPTFKITANNDNASNNFGCTLINPIEITNGTYTVSYWYKFTQFKSTTGMSGYVKVQYSDGSQETFNATIPNQPTNENNINKWFKVVQTFTTNASKTVTSIVNFYFYKDYALLNDSAIITYPKIEAGNTPTDWSPAPEDLLNDAANVNVMLSNESHFFEATAGGIPTETSIVLDVVGYKGSIQSSTTVGTITGLPSAGMTATVSSNGTTSTKITVAVTSALTSSIADYGVLTIPIAVNGHTINKKFNWVKAKAGDAGQPGGDAVTFQVYSNNGYALSINTPTITLQTFAYVGDIKIQSGATYQWYRYSSADWTAISGAINSYLTVSRDDVAFSNSYMCKMQFNNAEYVGVATVDDKNDSNKVFTTKPSNYAAGDLWVVGVDYAPAGVAVGTLLRAEHTNVTYGDVDWVTAMKYDKELNDLKDNIETYNQYFSFDSAEGLKISAKDNNGTPSQFSTSLTNERLSFNYGNEAIAYINGTKMNIKEAEIESPLTVTGKYSGSTMLQAPVINIGNFSIIVESNGSLSIVANI